MASKEPTVHGPNGQSVLGTGVAASPVTPPPPPVPHSSTEMPAPSSLASTKSPMDEFLEEWKEKGRSNLQFLHQRKLILKNPKIILEAGPSSVPGWRTPMTFAVQTIAVVALLISGVHFAATHIPGTAITTDDQPPSETEKALQKKQELITKINSFDPDQPVTLFFDNGSRSYPHNEALALVQKEAAQLQSRVTIEKNTMSFGLWLFTYLQPVFVGLALVWSSSFFKKGIIKKFGNAGNTSVADRCYLYISSVRTFWASVFLNIMLLAWQWIHYGNQADPVLEVFFASLVLCLSFSLFARWRMSRDLCTVLSLPDPKKGKKEISTQITLSGIKALLLAGGCQWILAFIVGLLAAKVLTYFV
ncbi:MAG TPA: hypothetical protein VI488_10920 [Candidatus Angelobacter sp.]